jgi:hypothetical protein
MNSGSPRSQEEANLFNPPFCSLLLTLAVADYVRTAGQGMPYPLAYLILPIVLHKPTRDALPLRTTKSLSSWLEENQEMKVSFAERAISLGDFIRAALIFSCTHNCLAFSDDGLLVVRTKPRGLAPYQNNATEEVRDCIARSQFLGRWMATAGEFSTVMALWGVRP